MIRRRLATKYNTGDEAQDQAKKSSQLCHAVSEIVTNNVIDKVMSKAIQLMSKSSLSNPSHTQLVSSSSSISGKGTDVEEEDESKKEHDDNEITNEFPAYLMVDLSVLSRLKELWLENMSSSSSTLNDNVISSTSSTTSATIQNLNNTNTAAVNDTMESYADTATVNDTIESYADTATDINSGSNQTKNSDTSDFTADLVPIIPRPIFASSHRSYGLNIPAVSSTHSSLFRPSLYMKRPPLVTTTTNNTASNSSAQGVNNTNKRYKETKAKSISSHIVTHPAVTTSTAVESFHTASTPIASQSTTTPTPVIEMTSTQATTQAPASVDLPTNTINEYVTVSAVSTISRTLSSAITKRSKFNRRKLLKTLLSSSPTLHHSSTIELQTSELNVRASFQPILSSTSNEKIVMVYTAYQYPQYGSRVVLPPSPLPLHSSSSLVYSQSPAVTHNTASSSSSSFSTNTSSRTGRVSKITIMNSIPLSLYTGYDNNSSVDTAATPTIAVPNISVMKLVPRKSTLLKVTVRMQHGIEEEIMIHIVPPPPILPVPPPPINMKTTTSDTFPTITASSSSSSSCVAYADNEKNVGAINHNNNNSINMNDVDDELLLDEMLLDLTEENEEVDEQYIIDQNNATSIQQIVNDEKDTDTAIAALCTSAKTRTAAAVNSEFDDDELHTLLQFQREEEYNQNDGEDDEDEEEEEGNDGKNNKNKPKRTKHSGASQSSLSSVIKGKNKSVSKSASSAKTTYYTTIAPHTTSNRNDVNNIDKAFSSSIHNNNNNNNHKTIYHHQHHTTPNNANTANTTSNNHISTSMNQQQPSQSMSMTSSLIQFPHDHRSEAEAYLNQLTCQLPKVRIVGGFNSSSSSNTNSEGNSCSGSAVSSSSSSGNRDNTASTLEQLLFSPSPFSSSLSSSSILSQWMMQSEYTPTPVSDSESQLLSLVPLDSREDPSVIKPQPHALFIGKLVKKFIYHKSKWKYFAKDVCVHFPPPTILPSSSFSSSQLALIHSQAPSATKTSNSNTTSSQQQQQQQQQQQMLLYQEGDLIVPWLELTLDMSDFLSSDDT